MHVHCEKRHGIITIKSKRQRSLEFGQTIPVIGGSLRDKSNKVAAAPPQILSFVNIINGSQILSTGILVHM